MEETGTVRIFIHGLESSNQGTKAVFFREKFPDMITPNFPGDLQQRMDKLEHMLSSKSEIRIVGSSFGGLMATIFAIKNTSRVKRMVLLAPAINIVQFTSYRNATVSIPVHIYHGRNDEVIP
nr:YqiA/YcfP family alpha/beta fold hydrolase [Desulfobacteraceae bacterium]